MTTLADPVPGGRPGDVERATALSGELSGRSVHGVVLSYVDTAGIGGVKTVLAARLASAAGWGTSAAPSPRRPRPGRRGPGGGPGDRTVPQTAVQLRPLLVCPSCSTSGRSPPLAELLQERADADELSPAGRAADRPVGGPGQRPAGLPVPGRPPERRLNGVWPVTVPPERLPRKSERLKV
ncbi:putative Glutamine synthetase [Streptomyces azureus]|uniref:Putative Glutamine synthetase n=1 Tax=Streptomyces azureus TaxID=146537 RepID=A0A0K8PS60_STRAJ|nr:putative Glutamine synthetase [Streptomyces azureus]